MKFITKIVLTLLFILFFLIFVISGAFRFQLLNPDFWQKTFDINGSYTMLSRVVKDNLETQVIAEGGKKSDVKVLTDLITPDNLKDFIDRNIKNLLGFINRKDEEVIVYIPISKIPKSLLPTSLSKITEQTNLQDLLREMNVTSISISQIQKIRVLNTIVNITLFSSISLLTVVLFALFRLTKKGERFIFVSLALVLAGFATFVVAWLLDVLRVNLAQDLLKRTDLARVIIGVTIPSILQEVSRVWFIEAIFVATIGIVLFFLKKKYNK